MHDTSHVSAHDKSPQALGITSSMRYMADLWTIAVHYEICQQLCRKYAANLIYLILEMTDFVVGNKIL